MSLGYPNIGREGSRKPQAIQFRKMEGEKVKVSRAAASEEKGCNFKIGLENHHVYGAEQ